jgi:hypothetical protein
MMGFGQKNGQKVPRCWIFSGLAYSETSLAGVLALLIARLVEIEVPIVVLLNVRRAGASIMKLNGKCQLNHFFQAFE